MRLATADSSPPVPELVSSSRSLFVLNTRLAPAVTSARIAANSGPRWSIMGRFIARTIRSGSGVGPGIRSWVEKLIGRAPIPGLWRPRNSALVQLRRVRKEGNRARALERGGQRALMTGACARHATRQDLAPIADEATQ